jgi:hypothetical protein
MKHLRLKRENNLGTKNSYSKLILFLLLSVSILFKIFLIIQSFGVSTSVSSLEKESEEIVMENRKLQRELVSKTSLRDLEVKAPELGFVNQPQPISVKVDEVFAQVLR